MWKGKVYAWSLQTVVYGAVYNVDLFKQLGLKIPASFAQVLDLCKKVAAAGKIPFVQNFGLAGAFIVGHQRYGEFVYGADPKWDDKRIANQVTFASSPTWRRTLQSIVDMKDAGCFQPGSQGTSSAQQDTMLATGQAVMSLVPSAELPNIYAINPNLKLAWFNVPPDDPKNAVVVAIPQSMAVNAATHNPAEAKKYMNFIAREQQSTLFAKVAGGLSVLDMKKGNVPANMSALLPFFKAGKIVGSHDAGWPNTVIFTQAFQPGIIGLITGQTTVDGILADMDRLWNTPG
jgi:raffinose/stachyose/melibiose transport system substrate-binding protein